jgi:hypothetical protein
MPPKATALQMQMYDDRLASFDPISKPKTKARPGWPLDAKTHPRLTPANMASAGFYFSPGSNEDSGDNCACFLCGVQLGGWAEDDDPHKEHVDRGNCAWAETVCQVFLDKANNVYVESPFLRMVDWTGLMNRKRDYATPEDLPSSATYSYVRENTYYSKDRGTCWWPHVTNKNHKVTPQNVSMSFLNQVRVKHELMISWQGQGSYLHPQKGLRMV